MKTTFLSPVNLRFAAGIAGIGGAVSSLADYRVMCVIFTAAAIVLALCSGFGRK